MTKKFTYTHLIKKSRALAWLIIDFTAYFFPFRSIKKRKTDENIILYVGEYFPVRIQRIVKYLKKRLSYEFVLYVAEWGYEPKLIGEYFDRIEVYRNKYHLLKKLNTEKLVKLVHSFEPKAYYQYLTYKALQCPFVYDIQDVLINYFHLNPPHKWQKKNLVYEKELLRLSDGLISHSLELNEALRNHHVTKRNPSLFFPLYCDEENFRPIRFESRKTAKIKFVYIGGINALNDPISSNFLPFIKKLDSTYFDFTIYPSPIGEYNFYKEYKSLEQQYPTFHMEKSQAFNRLDLSGFDFGVLPFEHESSETFYSKNLYASTMKFFVYLEMGIPVLVSEYWRFPAWIVKRYNLGIVTSYAKLDKLKEELDNLDIQSKKKSIALFREKFGLKRNIHRIEEYYRFIMQSATPQNPKDEV